MNGKHMKDVDIRNWLVTDIKDVRQFFALVKAKSDACMKIIDEYQLKTTALAKKAEKKAISQAIEPVETDVVDAKEVYDNGSITPSMNNKKDEYLKQLKNLNDTGAPRFSTTNSGKKCIEYKGYWAFQRTPGVLSFMDSATRKMVSSKSIPESTVKAMQDFCDKEWSE